jgi:hypothetical protein
MALHVRMPSTVTFVVGFVPEHAPDQFENTKSVSGTAEIVNAVADVNVTWQVEPAVPQRMPPPLTVPPKGRGEMVRL